MPNIAALIPQKAPFVMVGQLLHCDETTTCTSFIIDADNVMVSDGEFTEGGLMENIAQTAAVRAGYMAEAGDEVKGGYIASLKNFEVLRLPKVGDELITEVAVADHVFDMTVISGKVTCNGMVLAKCEMSIFEGK
ncbi:MAG: 3-hydroxyacyl-ACP dehydratase [Mucilaginibacter sp.]